MRRRLLLLMAGLGAGAVAAVLWSGTAQALSPAATPLARAGSLPASPVIPQRVAQPAIPRPATPSHPAAAPLARVVPAVPVPVHIPTPHPVAGTVSRVVGVVHTVRTQLAAVVPHVAHVIPAHASLHHAAPKASATPVRPRIVSNARFADAHPRADRASHAVSTPAHARSHARPSLPQRPVLPSLVGDLAGRALGPVPMSNAMPFMISETRSAFVNAWSRRLTAAVADQPRPGFMLGISCPG